MSYYTDNLAKGKSDEQFVIESLRNAGYSVSMPTEYQDRREDIDCILEIDGCLINVSIKSQQAGLKYGQIYFELQQKVKPQYYEKFGCSNGRNSWVDSNHITGKHDMYAIYQGSYIYLILRDTVDCYVEENGWLHTKPLSRYRREALERDSSYYFCDSKCGFLLNNVLSCFHTIKVN